MSCDYCGEDFNKCRCGPVENDPVHHPAHYKLGGIEVIDALEAWGLNFHRANAVKYIARAGKKDPTKEIEDLKKSIWYLQRDIARLEKIK